MNYIKEDLELYNEDCVLGLSKLPDEYIDFSIFSPPFAELYVYSDNPADMSNVRNYDEFFEHFNFMLQQLSRVMKSGRLVAMHVADLPMMKERNGYLGLKDLTGDFIRAYENNGFMYHSRITIWKNPALEMQRTKSIGLLFRQLRKDSSISRVGIPDYLIVFRKKGENLEPITKQNEDTKQLNYCTVEQWQRFASPIWLDIDYTKTLQSRGAKGKKDEKHICPLQLETIKRAIFLWSNENDLVLSPFAGIGSELYIAKQMNRKAIGFELKESYFEQAVKNIKTLYNNSEKPMF